MLSHAVQLKYIAERWSDLSTARDNVQQWMADDPDIDLGEQIEDLVAQTEYTNQGIALYQSAIAAVEQHKSREPWYQAALSFIPSTRRKRIIQHLHDISSDARRVEKRRVRTCSSALSHYH